MNKTGDEMVTNVVHDSRASRDITVTAKLKILEHAEAAMKDLDSVSDNAGNPAHMLMKIKTYNELASANWIFGRVKKGLDESLESLELNRSLLSPEVSVDKQWDLLKLRYDALNVEGNFLNVQGAFNSATNAFADAEATAISMQKSGNEKRRGEALLDFTQALGRVGDVQRTHRDFDGAIKSYDRSLAIQNAYLKGHPDDRQWISARTQTYNRIGDDLLRITNHEALMTVGPDGTTLLKQESEYLPARIEYRHALADRDRLAELEDKNTDYGRDLVWSLTLYGMSLIPSDLPKAHETLSRAEKRAEEMLNDDKNNTEWIRYRALIHSFLGDTLFLTNRRVEAFEEYEAASQDRETLTGIDSQNLRWQRDKFYTLDRLYRMQTIAQLSEASVTLKVALQLGETIRHLLPGDAALAAEVNDLKYPRNGTIRQ
jgi:tetratricopeptide (TPR) repeat protein